MCATDTFHITWVTLEPTSLQDRPYIHENPSHHLSTDLWDWTEASLD